MPQECDIEARAMVDQQIRRRGIHNPRVLAAMRAVPRHRFVPLAHRERAYEDGALPTAEGQTISQPYVVALMTQMLDLSPGMRVLEVGTGSGYQAAVLSELGATVVTVERHVRLADAARWSLEQAGYGDRVSVVVGDGSMGWPEGAPYDRALVTAAAPVLPPPLCEQVILGGRIVIPTGDQSNQRLVLHEHLPDGWRATEGIAVRFVPLLGHHGWPAAGGE
jgi:protein-L-isoaspartate(D-aspartate) O-methyltransferase